MASSHGRFVSYELATTDMESAKAFYSDVLDWGNRTYRRQAPPTRCLLPQAPP